MNALFQRLTAGRDQLRSIHVPEIDSTIWFRPMSLAEEKAILGPGGKYSVETAARVVCRLSLDKEGKRLFDDEMLFGLIEAGDRTVIYKIAAAIMGEQATVAVAEGN